MRTRRNLVFDTETNGLYYEVTKIHVLVIWDMDALEMLVFRQNDKENTIEDGIRLLADADLLVGHNIVGFDLPMIEKLYPWFSTEARIRDTMICTKLIFSDQKEKDFESFRKGTLPGSFIGRHSLAAWGHRLGEHKGDYGKDKEEGEDVWAEWNQEMEDYGVQDVRVTALLAQLIDRQQYPEDPIRFEHRFADLMARQERNGFVFNKEDAEKLYARFGDIRDEIVKELAKQFKPWYKAAKWKKGAKAWSNDSAEITTPSRDVNYKDVLTASRVKDAPFCPITLVEFKPGSRDMVADRLQRLFGWTPKAFTETGKPQVSEDILRDLVGTEGDEEEDEAIQETEEELYNRLIAKIPQAKFLADYFLIQKRIGQLAEGKNGWLKLVKDDGKIHGSVNTLGTVSRRCSHSKPNVTQTPAVRSPWGWEMRSLWTVPEGWVLIGSDLAGIELRMFAEALYEFDGGAYANIVVDGDVHSVNQKAFGVPTRDDAKTAMYALLYGAGDMKLGSIIGGGAEAGKMIKSNYMRAVPAYRSLKSQIEKKARRGYVEALDQGKLYVRSPHKALNVKLQSDGALIAKQFALQIEENLLDAGMQHGWDGDFTFVVHAHDEVQIAVRTAPGFSLNDYVAPDVSHIINPDEKEQKKLREKFQKKHYNTWVTTESDVIKFVTDTTEKSVTQAQHYFNVKCRLDSSWACGRNWAETH